TARHGRCPNVEQASSLLYDLAASDRDESSHSKLEACSTFSLVAVPQFRHTRRNPEIARSITTSKIHELRSPIQALRHDVSGVLYLGSMAASQLRPTRRRRTGIQLMATIGIDDRISRGRHHRNVFR